ncbi:hypothetical protein OEA41_006392 [Lepraria neglecta]|uniref:Uncharacterized protein n=1 Tax=Lepraria neglecta TaxID=209136 RepID=A0AAD9ZBH8_9LECA|nr:hypothetical protein OEA41_006392 [Lepraria neglecta]
MAVAGRGLRKESFVERRYNYPTTETDNSPEASRKRTSIPLQQFFEGSQASRNHKVEISAPPPTHISRSRTPRDKFEQKNTNEQPLQLGKYPSSSSDAQKQGGSGSGAKVDEPKKDAASYDIHLKSDGKSPNIVRSTIHLDIIIRAKTTTMRE